MNTGKLLLLPGIVGCLMQMIHYTTPLLVASKLSWILIWIHVHVSFPRQLTCHQLSLRLQSSTQQHHCCTTTSFWAWLLGLHGCSWVAGLSSLFHDRHVKIGIGYEQAMQLQASKHPPAPDLQANKDVQSSNNEHRSFLDSFTALGLARSAWRVLNYPVWLFVIAMLQHV